MTESLLRTVIELQEESMKAQSRGQHRLARLLERAMMQLEKARREAMPPGEPVIILGYVNEEEPHG
jgi:hypothetical protein